MEVFDIKDFTGGWFVGDFTPTLFATNQFEVALKEYKQGAYEKKHYHLLATEFTVIINGTVRMNGAEYSSGAIVKIMPGESTDFEAITDVSTMVVKVPSAKNDKYIV